MPSYGFLSGAAFTVTYSIAGIFAGQLADRVDRVKMLGAACILWSLMSYVSGATNTFWVLFAARMMLGLL